MKRLLAALALVTLAAGAQAQTQREINGYIAMAMKANVECGYALSSYAYELIQKLPDSERADIVRRMTNLDAALALGKDEACATMRQMYPDLFLPTE